MPTSKKKKDRISNPTSHLKKIENQQMKPNARRKKDVIKVRVEILKIENRKTIESMKPNFSSLKRSTKLTNSS